MLGARRRGWPFGDVVLIVYPITLVGLCWWHKQPWPYFFVLLIPIVSVLHAALFDRLFPALAGRRFVAGLLGVALVAGGVIHPLRRVMAVNHRYNADQRRVVQLAHALLEDDESYVAGVDMIWDREQASPDLAWLDRARLNELHAASPDELAALRRKLERTPIKLMIINYRMKKLPEPLQQYQRDLFIPVWQNIAVYAPRIEGSRVDLLFDGTYRVSAPVVRRVTIDGVPTRVGTRIWLTRGEHRCRATGRFRLVLQVPPPQHDPDAGRPEQIKLLFHRIYRY